MRGSARRGGVAVVVVAVVAVLAAVAGAVTTVKKNFTVTALKTQSHAAKCAKGQIATGGGFTFQQSSDVELQAAYPSGRKWTVQARNIDHHDHAGSAIALCKKDKGLVRKTKTLATNPSDTDVQVTVHCPSGSMAIGGGGQLTGPDSATERGSFPSNGGNAWGTRWALPGTGSVGLAGYAICDKRVRGYNIVQNSGDFVKRVFLGNAGAIATCEGTDKLVGGGFFRLSDQTWYTKVGPKGQGWQVFGNGFTNAGPFLSFAVCAK